MRNCFMPKLKGKEENFNLTYYFEWNASHINLVLVPHNIATPYKQQQCFPDSGCPCATGYKERKGSSWFKIGLVNDSITL